MLSPEERNRHQASIRGSRPQGVSHADNLKFPTIATLPNAPFPATSKLTQFAHIRDYIDIRADGEKQLVAPNNQLSRATIDISQGSVEIATALPDGISYKSYVRTGQPVVWIIPGWWGDARQNTPVADHLASMGYMTRVVSPLGHLGSEFANPSLSQRFFGAYERCIAETLNQFPAERKAILAHSAGFVWFNAALPSLTAETQSSIQSVFALAPLLDVGGSVAFRRFLAGIGSYLADRDFRSFFRASGRFAGQFMPFVEKTGLGFTMDSTATMKLALFRKSTPEKFVEAYRGKLSGARYADYIDKCFLSLLRSPMTPNWSLAKEKVFLLGPTDDRNYTQADFKSMSARIKATYEPLEGVCHQALAIPEERKKVIDLVVDKLQGGGALSLFAAGA